MSVCCCFWALRFRDVGDLQEKLHMLAGDVRDLRTAWRWLEEVGAQLPPHELQQHLVPCMDLESRQREHGFCCDSLSQWCCDQCECRAMQGREF